MKHTTLVIFILTLVAVGNAKTLRYVELGINQSKFRNQDCKSKVGPAYGLGLDYYPIKSYGAFIGTGLLYQNKKLLVEDKTWPSFLFSEFAEDVWTGDFDINISYIEIPLQIGFSIKLYDQLSASIFTGYSFSIPIKDYTKTKNRKVRELTPDERGKFDFDYVLVDESGVSTSKNYNIGFRISWNQFAFVINYKKALSFTKDMEGKSIQGKIDSYRMSFAYLF